MTIIQRIIIWMGCNALILLWLQPPTYLIHADGTRFEHDFVLLWDIHQEWSVNIPLLGMRILIILLVTAGMFFVFRPNTKKEGAK
tara:strand:- start:451 stop:705 length:255 start_codon:yes stop_codon:yes gene_type:complete